MYRSIRYMIISLLAAVLASCADSDRFAITLSIADLGTQGVEMVYYADGAVHSLIAQPQGEDGVVKFVGEARNPALVEISLAGTGQPLCTLVARNGEHIKCAFTLADPLDIVAEGSETVELMATFVRENREVLARGDAAEVNMLVKQFVIDNPDNVASTALLTTRFQVEDYESLADSLLNIIAVEARPLNMVENFNAVLFNRASVETAARVTSLNLYSSTDSVFNYSPGQQAYTLFAFTGADNTPRSALTTLLRNLSKRYAPRRLKVVEITLQPDSTRWQRDAKADSAQWVHCIARGAAADLQLQRLSVNHTPYFIVSDSTGRQLLRTPSASKVEQYVNTLPSLSPR